MARPTSLEYRLKEIIEMLRVEGYLEQAKIAKQIYDEIAPIERKKTTEKAIESQKIVYDRRFEEFFKDKKIGMLTIIGKSERRGYWICRCDCGKVITIYSSNLRDGSIRSCGCVNVAKLAHQKYGYKIKNYQLHGELFYAVYKVDPCNPDEAGYRLSQPYESYGEASQELFRLVEIKAKNEEKQVFELAEKRQ